MVMWDTQALKLTHCFYSSSVHMNLPSIPHMSSSLNISLCHVFPGMASEAGKIEFDRPLIQHYAWCSFLMLDKVLSVINFQTILHIFTIIKVIHLPIIKSLPPKFFKNRICSELKNYQCIPISGIFKFIAAHIVTNYLSGMHGVHAVCSQCPIHPKELQLATATSCTVDNWTAVTHQHWKGLL